MIFVEFCSGPCSPAWEPEIQSNTYNLQFQNELSIFRIVIHSNIWSISEPNSMTDLLNQVPGTPLHSSCKPGSNWTSQEHNWCQVPWCYVPLLHGQAMGKPWASEPWCSHPDIQLRITAFCFSVWPEFPVSISTDVTTYYNWWPVKGFIFWLCETFDLNYVT